jgi:D-serine deaminase-like pyridoxal phosphate-dependent protein
MPGMVDESPRERWLRYRSAIADEPLPCAVIDLDAFDANLERLLRPVRAAGKVLRPATKSIRVPGLLRRVLERGATAVSGLMTYSARETAFLADEGFEDLLLAYPTVDRRDLEALAAAARRTTVRVVCDAPEHLVALEAAAARAETELGVVLEVDLSLRPVERVHLGVRRSPLRTARDVVALAERLGSLRHLRFDGVMGYEAHVAGLGDRGEPARRALKLAARPRLERTRQQVAESLRASGYAVSIFNGGGTGNVDWAAADPTLTEVTAGSGLLDGHLFDRYVDIQLRPAAYFALQVVRRPALDIFTCSGGGYVASGAAGPDRLPLPALPGGASLLSLEGAGEVQTPVRWQGELAIGDPVFFRHAKSGELAEHFVEYCLIRGDRIEGRTPTYRGLGKCFSG